MSRKMVEVLQHEFDWAFAMLEKFVQTCPDEMWNSKLGGYYIGQQVLHVLGVVGFIILDKGERLLPPDYSNDVLLLSEDQQVSRQEVQKLVPLVKARADKYINSLNDDMLSQPHQGTSHRRKKDISHLYILHDLIAHLLYHLGTWDGFLRERGHEAIWQ